jgi:Na+/H+-translocating membrane pyrophosphatase
VHCYKGLLASAVLAAIGFYFHKDNFPISAIGYSSTKFYLASLVGLVVAGGMFMITEYFTSKDRGPVNQSQKLRVGTWNKYYYGIGSRNEIYSLASYSHYVGNFSHYQLA